MSSATNFVCAPILLLVSQGLLAAGAAGTDDTARVKLIIRQEQLIIGRLAPLSPLAEIYMQLTREHGDSVATDQYFLGRVKFGRDGVDFVRLVDTSGSRARHRPIFSPLGFVQMAIPDNAGLNSRRYKWRYIGREFLGQVRCWVYDLTPTQSSVPGIFVGRVWASEKDFNIVRFNGTYTAERRHNRYFHFDSWRVCKGPGFCLPASVYVGESELKPAVSGITGVKAHIAFWAYQPPRPYVSGEFSEINVPQDSAISDSHSETVDQEGQWQQHAESNVLTWLETAGMLAPSGDIEKILKTIVDNILAGNNVDYPKPIRCRLLLTTPLELFTVNDTIVISRGLFDVLPDEASLAAILAPEIAHILLRHTLKKKYGFNAWGLEQEDQVFKNELDFHNSQLELAAADKYAFDLLMSSPYKDQLEKSGRFLRTSSASCAALPNLFRPRFGNAIPGCGDSYVQMNRLANLAPDPEESDGPGAGLPLWSRVDVDSWTGAAKMITPSPERRYTPRENPPFGVLPVLTDSEAPDVDAKTEEAILVLMSARSFFPAQPVRK